MSTFSSHKQQQQQQQQQQQSVFPFETNYLPPSEFVVPKNFPQFYSSSFIHNETCLTEKQSIDCSSMAVETESGTHHHVTQNGVVSSDNKRKSKHGSSSSSLNSTLSKGGNKQQVKTKKQKGEKKATIMKKEEKKDKDGEEEAPKGYIHVRARRGQATDSHSLAERVRREKISKKMGTLQALVPGCDKVTGKALMLDEIINYVQSLQNQVEFLSMKLASVDPIVYTFGLMDHDSILFRSTLQGLSNNMALPNNRLIESTGGNTSGSTSPSQAFGTANSCLASPATSSTLSPTFPITHVDTAVYLPQAEHKPIFSPFQDAGGSYWGINEDDKQSNIVNQFGLSANNFYSLH